MSLVIYFYHDIDSLCLKELDIFSNNFDNFRVFNFAVARNQTGVNIFMSCASRYFSHNMNKDLWLLGDKLWKIHIRNTSIWDIEQRIYNKMFQHPDNNIKIPDVSIDIINHDLTTFKHNIDFLKPEYNLIQHPMCNFFKQIDIKNAYIIQFCGAIEKRSDGTDFIQNIIKEYANNYDLNNLKKNILRLFNEEWKGCKKRYGLSRFN